MSFLLSLRPGYPGVVSQKISPYPSSFYHTRCLWGNRLNVGLVFVVPGSIAECCWPGLLGGYFVKRVAYFWRTSADTLMKGEQGTK